MPVTHGNSLLESFAVQRRITRALVLREIITRFGRNNIGFLWLFLDPILFTVGVVALWTFTRNLHGFRVDVTPFVVTGYSSLLMWRNCSFRGLKAIEANRSLMYHRNVRVFDIFAARMLLEVAAVTASFIVVMFVTWAFDLIRTPRNLSLMLTGWFFLAWFSVALGIILGCLSEYTDVVERLWHPISYFILSVSGAFFMVDWLPASFQSFALYIPMLNATEMLRGGYYGDGVRVFYSVSTTAAVCLCMSLLACVLIQNAHRMLLARGQT